MHGTRHSTRTAGRLARTAALVAAATLGAWVGPVAAQQAPKRAITQIDGDLYRFQNNFHFSVFLVTPDGIIATDPIDADAARWLKAELDRRFGKPVKYLVYSHDHPDHNSGGEVFEDTAVVVAHENAKAVIVGEKRPTAVPDVTFADRMTIELGGSKVELRYLGRSHSDNLIVMHFPAERTVFAVDFVSVNRLPYQTLGDAYFPDWIDALKRLEAIDFDVLAPGHGPLGKPADVTAHRSYIEALHDGVLEGARAGKSVEQLKTDLTLPDYRGWGQYEAWRPLNIEGMYRYVQMNRRGN
jgi:glyoxylase-like metal-dependent hydrolase (beta-lactamase superfamily II)